MHTLVPNHVHASESSRKDMFVNCVNFLKIYFIYNITLDANELDVCFIVFSLFAICTAKKLLGTRYSIRGFSVSRTSYRGRHFWDNVLKSAPGGLCH